MPRHRDLLPDWFVGGAGKRRLLAALTDPSHSALLCSAGPPWTLSSLARAAGVHENNAVGRHVQVLVLAGLLDEAGGRYRLNAGSGLIAPIEELSRALAALPLVEIPPARGGR